MWEFPGGKRASDESVERALAREMKEEIGISISTTLPLLEFRYDYPDRKLLFHVRIIRDWTGTPFPAEGQELAWWSVKELDQAGFPPANEKIIRALQLPDIYFITPDVESYGRFFLDRIESVLATGVRLLRFRSNNLTGEKRREAAAQVVRLCRRYDCRFIYDGTPREARELTADGIHLSSARLKSVNARPLDRGYLVGVSCHDRDELRKASGIAADFALLGPVGKTPSHPGSIPLGWSRFADLVAHLDIPVYALGGLHREDLAEARRRGALGIAMISGLWNSEE